MQTLLYAFVYINVVGLFKPLSYQDRAVQLAYNNRSSQVCYEPFKPLSTNASEVSVWQDGEYVLIFYFVVKIITMVNI